MIEGRHRGRVDRARLRGFEDLWAEALAVPVAKLVARVAHPRHLRSRLRRLAAPHIGQRGSRETKTVIP